MLAHPPPQNSQVCSFGLSPIRSKRRIDHERHGSETFQRPRPISIASFPAMQHNKRASIYVSDASIILAQRAPIMSPLSPEDSLASPSNDTPGFMDHYAILELQPQASAEEITSAFRRLRVVYFQSDAKKYKALTTAFDVLRDSEARHAYDFTYRQHAVALSLSGLTGTLESPKHERKDSAMGDDPPMPILEEEEDVEAMRSQDPNWGLRHHQMQREPLIGTQPYQSYIPILLEYDGRRRHPTWKCSRPTYVGYSAVHSMPN